MTRFDFQNFLHFGPNSLTPNDDYDLIVIMIVIMIVIVIVIIIMAMPTSIPIMIVIVIVIVIVIMIIIMAMLPRSRCTNPQLLAPGTNCSALGLNNCNEDLCVHQVKMCIYHIYLETEHVID